MSSELDDFSAFGRTQVTITGKAVGEAQKELRLSPQEYQDKVKDVAQKAGVEVGPEWCCAMLARGQSVMVGDRDLHKCDDHSALLTSTHTGAQTHKNTKHTHRRIRLLLVCAAASSTTTLLSL